ncbi:MAG: hypothetical protein ACK5M7_07480 [Draconibacterium sp.]
MRNLLKQWMHNTGDTTPENLTPDRFNRETGKPLRKETIRGTMPGIR